MAKNKLNERFQQLAGIKPLYEAGSLLTEQVVTGCCVPTAYNYNSYVDNCVQNSLGCGNCDNCSCVAIINGVPVNGDDFPGNSGCTVVPGCMDNTATNYDPNATTDDGSCTPQVVTGCCVPTAYNYNSYVDNCEQQGLGCGNCDNCTCVEVVDASDPINGFLTGDDFPGNSGCGGGTGGSTGGGIGGGTPDDPCKQFIISYPTPIDQKMFCKKECSGTIVNLDPMCECCRELGGRRENIRMENKLIKTIRESIKRLKEGKNKGGCGCNKNKK